jgi:hypothetical protein
MASTTSGGDAIRFARWPGWRREQGRPRYWPLDVAHRDLERLACVSFWSTAGLAVLAVALLLFVDDCRADAPPAQRVGGGQPRRSRPLGAGDGLRVPGGGVLTRRANVAGAIAKGE